ncbi:MAG: type II toxin-antitoxin system prevent-host-death family antitoxin [Patescibacteria group bacterium]
MLDTVSITEFRKNAAKITKKVKAGQPLMIIQRSKPIALLVSLELYEKLEELKRQKSLK